MSDDTGVPRTWRGVAEDEVLRRLLGDAGARSALPREDLAAAGQAAREQWARRFRPSRRRTLSGRWQVAAAAAALAGIGGLIWWAGRTRPPIAPAPPVATIELWTGDVRIVDATGTARLLSSGMRGARLPGGTSLRTGRSSQGDGRVALRMAGGSSVRVDAASTLRLASEGVVELRGGAVYVDSGVGPARRSVAVRTASGLFEDRGTQFEVRTEGSGAQALTRLRVREGRVELDRGAGSAVITPAGYQLLVHGPEDPVLTAAPGYGPQWDWVVQSAPMPDIEGMKVRAFLEWLGRETGLRVELADARAGSLADSVVLHGSVRHLTPAQAPAVVLSSAGLRHRISGGTMFVFVPENEELPAVR